MRDSTAVFDILLQLYFGTAQWRVEVAAQCLLQTHSGLVGICSCENQDCTVFFFVLKSYAAKTSPAEQMMCFVTG